jgi:hypothetical protein
MSADTNHHRKSKTCTGNKTGKPLTEYDTESEARETALYASAEYKRNLTPYLCQTCNKWHLSPANRQTPSKKCAFCAGSDGQSKDAYATEQDAKRRAAIIRKESGVSLRTYACQYGNGWHLTKS